MFKKIILPLLGRLLLHILFWVAVLFFFISYFGFNSQDYGYVFSFSLFLMPITIAATYVFIYKLIPEYLIPKRYGLFALYSIYAIIITNYSIVFSVFFGLIYLSNFQYDNMAPISRSLLFVGTAVYLVIAVVSAFTLLKLNLKQANETKKLETKILETQLKIKEQELHYLKLQIHPHFLFNTLNTLYGFALKKANETPEMILKLSNLLDYLLYQVDKPFVLLSDEILHIQDYIELEKMRFNDTLEVNFEMNNLHNDQKIAPMLLIPFVENSFKHGSMQGGKMRINMDIGCQNGTLNFNLSNSHKPKDHEGQGIGLDNVKKRLELLYENKHELQISEESDIFKVSLQLTLN